MFNPISPARAQRILKHYAEWIATVSARYLVPEAAIKAILYEEMTRIDIMDPLVDLAVATSLFKKKDSSTGYAQIFGYVGLIAINFAVDRGLATYESLGIKSDHTLDAANERDVKTVWSKLHRDQHFNIEVATLNLLVCADEVAGHTDFSHLSERELKLVLTRYNANTRTITSYGEQAFQRYVEFQAH